MNHIIRSPHRGFNLLGDADSLFSGFFAPAIKFGGAPDIDVNGKGGFAPALDIIETGKGYEVRVDLPGVNKDDLSVSLKENILTIEAETKSEQTHEEGSVLKSERRIGRYYRALHLGTAVDEGNIRAEYTDGVLKLSLPRAAAVEGRKIDVDMH